MTQIDLRVLNRPL